MEVVSNRRLTAVDRQPGADQAAPLPTLLLADDHGVFVDALETVLRQHGFPVCTVARSRTETIAAARDRKPDLCILDRHFGDGDALEIVPELLECSPGTTVVMLTADPDPDGMLRAMQAGAVGYVHKSRGLAALVEAIRRASAGDVVVDLPSAGRTRRRDDVLTRQAAHLTDRERQCLALLVEGRNTTAMAHRLGVSSTTVRSHVRSLLTKLDVHSRLEAASLAVHHGLLDDPADPACSAPW